MSEAPRDSVLHDEPKEVGPNYFGYYLHEIQELLSKNDGLLPPLSSINSFSSSRTGSKVNNINIHSCNGKEAIDLTASSPLFSNGVGVGLSDFTRERLKASLKQGVTVLSQEVDEMIDPVSAMHRIQMHLKNKENLASHSNASDGDVSQSPCKKHLASSPPLSSIGVPMNAGTVGSESCDESQSNTCGIRHKRKRTSPLDFKGAEKENIEVNEDLQILLESDGSEAKEAVKRYSDELSQKLEHMEKQLEELLDIVMSKCRQMTMREKQQLRKLIQNLPPKNLDRVVEILQRGKLPEGHPCDEINVDFEKEDNVTLWRLYYYVQAVESAKKLSSQSKLANSSS